MNNPHRPRSTPENERVCPRATMAKTDAFENLAVINARRGEHHMRVPQQILDGENFALRAVAGILDMFHLFVVLRVKLTLKIAADTPERRRR